MMMFTLFLMVLFKTQENFEHLLLQNLFIVIDISEIIRDNNLFLNVVGDVINY